MFLSASQSNSHPEASPGSPLTGASDIQEAFEFMWNSVADCGSITGKLFDGAAR